MPELLPFVDLRAQYRNHADELNAAIGRVLDSAAFIMGPDLSAFEPLPENERLFTNVEEWL